MEERSLYIFVDLFPLMVIGGYNTLWYIYDSFPSYCFSPYCKEILLRLQYFCNVINEVQALSNVIFEKLKFFFSGIFLSIGCFFS